MFHDLLIIGGGASGIIAAIAAKDMGADAAIIEGNDRIGRKIITTGNGRCNITNSNIDIRRYHGENPNFSSKTLSAFGYKDTLSFFDNLGLPIISLEEGKMFPMSLQASSVIDILRFALEERNIPVYLNSRVQRINKVKNDFIINCKDGSEYRCRKVILAAGGKSAPSTGSDGSGFAIARSLGHRIIEPVPALVQLKLQYDHLKSLSGVKFNGKAKISVSSKIIQEECGEILFTDYGISGPPILQLSREASYHLNKKDPVTLSVDIMSDMSFKEMENYFENHFALLSYRSIYDSLIGIINKKIIPVILKDSGIADIHKPCSDLSWKEKLNLYSLLKDWTFTVSGTNSFSNSQVTAGGIATDEVDENTLESKLIQGLYFSGEILDIDGDCGGFNLQWAWSSGYIAARNAVLK